MSQNTSNSSRGHYFTYFGGSGIAWVPLYRYVGICSEIFRVKGASTKGLGTWGFGKRNCRSIGFGKYTETLHPKPTGMCLFLDLPATSFTQG